ncbi:hypothetical protein [Halobaculum sp. EA56]|uniref:hypothetical protein n=1 Tax=Halobaculum sp. EA56 TaxID=3421648 RepID=UPI003EBF7CCA
MTLEFPFGNRYGFPLPTPREDDPAISVSPGLNHVSIPPAYRSPSDIIGLADVPVIYAGQLVQTTSGRAFRVLARRRDELMTHLCAGTLTPRHGGQQLVRVDRIQTSLQDELGSLFRTAVRTVLSWILESDSFIDWYVEAFSRNRADVSREALERGVRELHREVDRAHPQPELGNILTDIRDSYGAQAAHNALDTTFSPSLISVAEQAVYSDDTRLPLAAGTLLDRARACRDIIDETIRSQPVASIPPTATELRQELDATDQDVQIDAAGPVVTGDELLPLFDAPPETAAEPTVELEHTIGCPSGLAWLVHRAFDSGSVGAVVHGDSASGNWITNPYIEALNPETQQFDGHWEWSTVVDRVVDQLVRMANGRRDPEQSLQCPLCALSTHRCDHNSCAYRQELRYLDSIQTELTEAITDTQSSL